MPLQPTIRRSLFASSLALIGLIGLIAFFAYLIISAAELRRDRLAADRWHDHTLEAIIAAGDVDAALHDRSEVPLTDEARLLIARLADLTVDNPDQQRRIARLRTFSAQAHRNPEAVNAILAAIVAEERRLLDIRRQRAIAAQQAQHRNTITIMVLGGMLLLCVGLGLALTARMALRIQKAGRDLADSEARYRLLAEHASDLVMRLMPDGTCTYVSPSAAELTGFPVSTYVGYQPMVMLHPDDHATALAALDAVRSGEASTKVTTFRSKHRGGHWLWFEANMRRIGDAGTTEASEVVCILRDISSRKALEEKLTRQATVDELTGLFNRRHFLECFSAEVERARRYGHALTLALIDLDHFKRVNDGHGHAAGDLVLSLTASIIRSTMRTTDIAGRIGGEELAVIMPDTDLDAAHVAAERLRRAISACSFLIAGGQAVHVTISIGLSQAQADEPISSIMSRADAALYAAKTAGRDRVLRAA